MLFVINKNKIFSYAVAASIVVCLFLFSITILPNSDVELMQVSSNTVNEKEENNNIKNENTYK